MVQWISGTSNSWIATDPVLVVGKGASAGTRSNAFTLFKNGNLTIAGTLTTSSDARLKTDVAPLGDVLSRLEGIRGVTYRFKDEHAGPADRQMGLLAQEVQQAFPELVHEDSEGHLSVAYGNFTAVLLEAGSRSNPRSAANADACLRARHTGVGAPWSRRVAKRRASVY